MEGTIMEVNLCPSTNIGRASCSVHKQDLFSFSKTENQAIVHLGRSVTAVCLENGHIQFITEYEKGMVVLGDEKSHSSGFNHTTDLSEVREFSNGNNLFSRHNVSFTPQLCMKNKGRTILPGKDTGNASPARKKGLCDQSLHIGENVTEMDHRTGFTKSVSKSSVSRKRKLPDKWDSDNEDEKKPRKNKQWSRKNMMDAIRAVQNGMRVRRAAKRFAVPRTTLKYKLDSVSNLPLGTDWSKDFSENIAEETERYMDAKKEKVNISAPKEPQLKSKVNANAVQNSSSSTGQNLSKKLSLASCEKSKSKTPLNDLPVVQHTKRLRSNSRILENKSKQLSKETQNSKTGENHELSKRIKEPQSVYSNQKCNKKQHSTCKDLRSKNEQRINKIREIKCNEKTKHFKLWSQETMKKAICAIEKGVKVSKAAIMFGIPRSTLRRRIPPSSSTVAQVLAKNHNSAVHGIRQSPRRRNIPPVVNDALPKDLKTQSSSLHPVNISLKDEVKGAGKKHNMNAQENKDYKEKMKVGKIKSKKRSKETMEKSNEIVDQGIPESSVAKNSSLPHTSLKTRKQKHDSNNMKLKCVGPAPHISTEDEDQIVDYINDSAAYGLVNVKKVSLLLCAEAAEKKLIWDIKKQGLPSDEWWDAFCSRRRNHIENINMIQSNQQMKITEARISLFHSKLSALQNSIQIHDSPLGNSSDCQTFTVQEFKYDLDVVTEWVGDGNDADKCACTSPETDAANKLVSTICCASAAGNSIPPMFVYHTESNYKIPPSGLVGPFGAAHFVHKVQDLTRKSDFYFKWFEKIFLRYASQSRPLILLFDPDTAFITPELIQLAHKNEIILLGLPPCSAHVTQPLNKTVFPALKKGFTFTSSLFKRIFVKGVNFNNFARCFKVAWNSSVDAAIIKIGFAETGIHPLDMKVILKSNL